MNIKKIFYILFMAFTFIFFIIKMGYFNAFAFGSDPWLKENGYNDMRNPGDMWDGYNTIYKDGVLDLTDGDLDWNCDWYDEDCLDRIEEEERQARFKAQVEEANENGALLERYDKNGNIYYWSGDYEDGHWMTTNEVIDSITNASDEGYKYINPNNSPNQYKVILNGVEIESFTMGIVEDVK